MDAELIEKVARAIYDASAEFQPGWDVTHPRYKDHARAQARAAIAALSATRAGADAWVPFDQRAPTAEDCDARGDVVVLRSGRAMLWRVKPERPVDATHWRRVGPVMPADVNPATLSATPKADEVSELRGVIERQEAMLWCLLSLHGGSVQVPDKLARERPTSARVHVAPGLGCTSLWIDQPATPQAAQVPEVLTMDDAARMGKSLEWWRGYTACLNAMQARVEFAAAQAQEPNT